MELKQLYGWSNTAEKKQAKCMRSMNYQYLVEDDWWMKAKVKVEVTVIASS
jgi:hypothetical protein